MRINSFIVVHERSKQNITISILNLLFYFMTIIHKHFILKKELQTQKLTIIVIQK